MVLKLYGFPLSTCTRLVALVCKEIGISYELITVSLPNLEQKRPEYLERQPFGQIPYIDDDGFILYESRAICRYLIKKYANQGTTGLIPTDLKEGALFEQAVSVEFCHFHTHMAPLIYELLVKVRFGGQTDQAKADEHLKNLEAKLDVLEIILSKQKYMAGDRLTLADLHYLPYGTALGHVGLTRVIDARPNLAKWWKELYQRQAWQAVKDGA